MEIIFKTDNIIYFTYHGKKVHGKVLSMTDKIIIIELYSYYLSETTEYFIGDKKPFWISLMEEIKFKP